MLKERSVISDQVFFLQQAFPVQNLLSFFLCAGSAETVNDGQFHTVELLTFNHMLNLSVDGGEPTTLDSQRRTTVAAATAEAPLYVGGKTTCPVSAAPGASRWLKGVAVTPCRDA